MTRSLKCFLTKSSFVWKCLLKKSWCLSAGKRCEWWRATTIWQWFTDTRAIEKREPWVEGKVYCNFRTFTSYIAFFSELNSLGLILVFVIVHSGRKRKFWKCLKLCSVRKTSVNLSKLRFGPWSTLQLNIWCNLMM